MTTHQIGTFSYARIGGRTIRDKRKLPSDSERSNPEDNYVRLSDEQRAKLMFNIDRLMKQGLKNHEIAKDCKAKGLVKDDSGKVLSDSRLNVIVWKYRKSNKFKGNQK